MIDAIARKMAVGIKSANPDHPASVEVLRFALASIIVNASIVLLSVAIAIPLHHVPGVMLALASFYLLRMVSGGYHLNSSVACILLTAATANAIPYIGLPGFSIPILTILSIVLAYLFAPSNMQNRSRISSRYFPLLKLIAMLLIASNLLLSSDIIAVCFFIQTASLIRVRR